MEAADGPSVSVIIPVFNQHDELQLCLEAVRRQNYPLDRLEIIVVDNGSHSPLNLDECAVPVTCIQESQRGSYAARNRGIACSTSEILAFTDADCVPAPDWVERGVARMVEVGEAGLVGGRIEVTVHDPLRPTLAERYERAWAFPQEAYLAEGFSATANLFTTRTTFERVGVFDASLMSSGDWEWGQRVRSRGFPQRFSPDVIVFHPARRTVRDLTAKAARVSGAMQVMADRRGQGLRGILGAIKRLYLRLRYHGTDERLCGLSERISLAGLTAVLEIVCILERCRVYLGGRPRRT